MLDNNFIRCSTMIAELLMKYKDKENEIIKENDEPEIDASPFRFLEKLQQTDISISSTESIKIAHI